MDILDRGLVALRVLLEQHVDRDRLRRERRIDLGKVVEFHDELLRNGSDDTHAARPVRGGIARGDAAGRLECAVWREGRQDGVPARRTRRDGDPPDAGKRRIARCGHLRANLLERRSWTGRLRAADPERGGSGDAWADFAPRAPGASATCGETVLSGAGPGARSGKNHPGAILSLDRSGHETRSTEASSADVRAQRGRSVRPGPRSH